VCLCIYRLPREINGDRAGILCCLLQEVEMEVLALCVCAVREKSGEEGVLWLFLFRFWMVKNGSPQASCPIY